MPLSQKGHQNFWLSYPHQPSIVARWMNLAKLPSPGRPVARMRIETTGVLLPGHVISIDGTDSHFSRVWTWTQVSGPTVLLAPTDGRVTFAPMAGGTVRLQLVTSLGELTSEPVLLDVPVVDRPTGSLTSQRTYADLLGEAGTWQDVLNKYATWAGVLTGIPGT